MNNELIIDLFCGGGGASTGIEQALGRPVDIAINHSEEAIEMHRTNHPGTLHFTEDVFAVNPADAVKGRPVGLLWASPDCTHHSRAKGGTPVKKEIRSLANVVIDWAKQVRPRVIMLENVPEFRDWGPLKKVERFNKKTGKTETVEVPDKSRKGEDFIIWRDKLKAAGYKVEFRDLVAADYGTPTNRKRFFLIARCDGQPIVWPSPTHGEQGNIFGLPAYRTAAECIDFTIPCPSIFLTKKEVKEQGLKCRRPLAENTMQRIARGVQKFIIDNPKPFIIGIDNQSSKTGNAWGSDKPLNTITTKNRFAFVTPFLSKYYSGVTGSEVDAPMHTVTAIDHNALVMPLLSTYHGVKGNESRCYGVDSPIMTVDTQNRFGVVSTFLTKFYGTNIGSSTRKPMPTITSTGQHIGEVQAFLIKYYGTGVGQSVKEPMHTVTGRDTFGLVTVAGQQYQIADIGLRMLQPRELATAQGFDKDYVLTGTPTSQVHKIGNSVCPPMAKALVKANCSRRAERMVG